MAKAKKGKRKTSPAPAPVPPPVAAPATSAAPPVSPAPAGGTAGITAATTDATTAALPVHAKVVQPIVSAQGLSQLRAQTRAMLAGLETSVKEFAIEQPLTQDLLQAAAVLSALATDFDKAWEALKVVLRTRRHAGGKFEVGRAVIVFKSGERRAPAWKDEATANAARLAAIAGQSFDPKLYQDKVLQATVAVPTADQVTIAVGD